MREHLTARKKRHGTDGVFSCQLDIGALCPSATFRKYGQQYTTQLPRRSTNESSAPSGIAPVLIACWGIARLQKVGKTQDRKKKLVMGVSNRQLTAFLRGVLSPRAKRGSPAAGVAATRALHEDKRVMPPFSL